MVLALRDFALDACPILLVRVFLDVLLTSASLHLPASAMSREDVANENVRRPIFLTDMQFLETPLVLLHAESTGATARFVEDLAAAEYLSHAAA
jgi:hypothetical protein